MWIRQWNRQIRSFGVSMPWWLEGSERHESNLRALLYLYCHHLVQCGWVLKGIGTRFVRVEDVRAGLVNYALFDFVIIY